MTKRGLSSNKAKSIRKRLGDELGLQSSQHNLGLLEMDQGDYGRARQELESALAISEKHGLQRARANNLCDLAFAELGDGSGNAPSRFREALSACAQLRWRENIAYCLVGCGAVAIAGGNLEQAGHFLGQADRLCDDLPLEAGDVRAGGGRPGRARPSLPPGRVTGSRLSVRKADCCPWKMQCPRRCWLSTDERAPDRHRHLPVHGHRGLDEAAARARRRLRRRSGRASPRAAGGLRPPRRCRGRHAGRCLLRRLRPRQGRACGGSGGSSGARRPGRSGCGWAFTPASRSSPKRATSASTSTAPPG